VGDDCDVSHIRSRTSHWKIPLSFCL